MMQGILGVKKGMTQIFDEEGLIVPVTIVEAGPCYVTQKKTREKDGYFAVQIAFQDKKEKRTTKALQGHFAKAKVANKRILREFRFSDFEELELGSELKADRFSAGDEVTVSVVSKGKGFQGVVKRHNFAGGPKTHGQSDRLRAPGSIGQSSNPSRVFKGIKMGGRMGNERITLKNVPVVKVDAENNLIFLKGSIPGAKNSIVEIKTKW
ncbi:MAG TPA: 50S ribosomal protein L3 [Caldithrix abyssi]|uniref:Large ribosomal subunit protein uL3 n=1 Tax=Caldithrix abyssi TaxID=187145 RepID=A0A7V4U475_CALAY|nr:50S ribosomal protein L3 [Caldithrix abyssi]